MDILISVKYYITFVTSYTLASLYCFYKDCNSVSGKGPVKIQKSFDSELLYESYVKVIPFVAWNVYVMVIPFILFCSSFPVSESFGLINEILISGRNYVLMEIFFYTSHRMLHWKPLMNWSHHVHHQIRYPIGPSALYSHWFDLYINMLSPLIGLFGFGFLDGYGIPEWFYLPAHLYTVLFWIVLSTFSTVVTSHGGYKGLSDYHTLHHRKVDGNYGINSKVLDYFFGTLLIED